MRARLRSWWQQIKQRWVATLVVTMVLVVVIAFIIIGYHLNWTGFKGKTLWGAELDDADLINAKLVDASVTQKQLVKAKSLKGATMPDESKHP